VPPVTLDAIGSSVHMPASLSTPRRISFGPYEADLQVGELRKQGVRVRLQKDTSFVRRAV
jgi:hypothetical protein